MDSTELSGTDTAVMLAADDAAALLEYVISHICPDVHRILRRRFSPSLNEQDIEDAISAALSRLWLLRRSYDRRRASLHDYFYVIARNAAIDILRAKARHNALLSEMMKRAQTRTHETSRGGEGRGERSSVRLKEVARAMRDFSAMDQEILLAYALAEGQEHWAADVSDQLGVPASTIRVRRLRLIDKLRRRLMSEGSQSGGGKRMVTDRESNAACGARPQRSFEKVSRDLVARREELIQVLGAIRADLEPEMGARSQLVEAAETPFGFFKRLWNRAVDDGSINDPTRSSTLKARGSWMLDVERGNAKLRQASQEILRRCQAVNGKLSFGVEEVERSLIGVSQIFQSEMPEMIAREGRGRLVVKWNGGRGRACWHDGTPSQRTFDVEEALRNSAEHHGNIANKKERDALVAQMKDDLRACALQVPSFECKREESKTDATVLEWRLARGESPSIDFPKPGEKFAIIENPPSEAELDLWSNHRELADLLDDAVCIVVQAQHSGVYGDHPEQRESMHQNVLQPLVELIQDTTGGGYPPSAVLAMLLPFVDEQWARAMPNGESLPAYERAIKFLAAELEPPTR